MGHLNRTERHAVKLQCRECALHLHDEMRDELTAALTEAHDILTDGTCHDTAGRAWAVLDAALNGASKPTNMRSGKDER